MSKPVSLKPAPWDADLYPPPASVKALAQQTFAGTVSAADFDYMAKALLQMNDEIHVLRQRLALLEAKIHK